MSGYYRAVPCNCGWERCSSFIVDGLAAEAKFTERQARYVAELLNLMEADPDDAIYPVTCGLDARFPSPETNR